MQYIRRYRASDNADDASELPIAGSVQVTVTPRRASYRFVATPFLIIYFFLAIIAIGTALLLLPFTNREGGATPFLTALFTATSAITCTGLVVQDTAAYWTRAGQVIIMAMIYLGGLGFMTMATFLIILLGQRVSLTQRLMMREQLMIDQVGGMVRLTVGIVIVATSIQVIGFIALFVYFYLFSYTPADAVWQAAFHAVSAFNGAGFLILSEPDGLLAYRSEGVLLGIIAALIFIGAISYLVIIDMATARRFSRFSLNTKLVLVATFALTIIAAVAFFAVEYANPDTLGGMTLEDKLTASVFQAVSSRTAGFTIAGLSLAHDTTNVLTAALMFIGGASASVAGGVKVNTLAVVFAGIVALIRQRNHAAAFGREIPENQIRRAYFILIVSAVFVFLVVLTLTITERGANLMDILYETASAFGTVGLSTGITPSLSAIGQVLIVATMFIGKLGPLTVGLTMAQRPEHDLYRYAQERVTIG